MHSITNMTPIKISHKKLKKSTKKDKQKYLILISDQTVIIENEWQTMKKATRHCRVSKKSILDMLPTHARINAQTTGLSKLLESLEIKKQ